MKNIIIRKILSFLMISVLLVSLFSCDKSEKPSVDSSAKSSIDSNNPNDTPGDKKMYYFDFKRGIAGYGVYVSIKALQGIVNKNGPLLLTSEDEIYFRDAGQTWMEYLKSKGYEFEEIYSYNKLLSTFKGYFKNIILFDDIKNRDNWTSAHADFACMVASLTNYLPINSTQKQIAIIETGLEVADPFVLGKETIQGNVSQYLNSENLNIQTKIYEWAFDNFKELFNQETYMTQTSECLDFAVQNKMFYMYNNFTTNSQDKELTEKVNAYFGKVNDGVWPMKGWVDHENEGLQMLKREGGMINTYGTSNLSFLKMVDAPKTFQQKSKYKGEYDESKTYLTFISSEADTVLRPSSFQQGGYIDEYRGKVPVNWGLVGNLVEDFPIIAQYYTDTAGVNDYFFSSGASTFGYLDYDSDLRLKSREDAILKNQKYLKMSDQKYIDMFGDKFTPDDAPYDVNLIIDYLKKSGAKAGITPIFDGMTNGALISNDVFLLSRGNYEFREADNKMSFGELVISGKRAEPFGEIESEYFLVDAKIALDRTGESGVELLTQSDGSGYKFYIDGALGYIVKQGKEPKDRQVLAKKTLKRTSSNEVRFIAIADGSDVLTDGKTVLRLYVDGLLIGDVMDSSFKKGKSAVFSDLGVEEGIINIVGSLKSQAQQIVDKILKDDRKFISIYTQIFNNNYTLNQLGNDPTPGAFVNLSPTEIYKIVRMLKSKDPNRYEVINLDEFIEYAKKYYIKHNTIYLK